MGLDVSQRRFHAGAGGGGHRPLQIVARPPNLAVLLTHCGQLILRKISDFDAVRCRIFRLKCTEFNFRCGSATDPARGAYSAPQDPLAVFKGPTSKEREEEERGREEEGKGREEKGKGRVWKEGKRRSQPPPPIFCPRTGPGVSGTDSS